MRGLRSLIVLLVIAIPLGWSTYRDSTKPADSGAPKRDKVFTVDADKIEEISLKSESGERTRLQKAGNEWKIVAPAGPPPALEPALPPSLVAPAPPPDGVVPPPLGFEPPSVPPVAVAPALPPLPPPPFELLPVPPSSEPHPAATMIPAATAAPRALTRPYSPPTPPAPPAPPGPGVQLAGSPASRNGCASAQPRPISRRSKALSTRYPHLPAGVQQPGKSSGPKSVSPGVLDGHSESISPG